MDVDLLEANVIAELVRANPGLARLAKNEDALTRIQKGYQAQDVATVRNILEDLQILDYCVPICRWICTWQCVRVCRLFCREIPEQGYEPSDLREFAQGVAQLAVDDDSSKRLIDAVAREDSQTFHKILGEFELQRFCYILCKWICFQRCRLFCSLICPSPDIHEKLDVVGEFRQSAEVLGKLAESPDAFHAVLDAYNAKDIESLRSIFDELGLLPFCILLCRWLCIFHCIRVCHRLCTFPRRGFSTREISVFLQRWGKLAAREQVLDELVYAIGREDQNTVASILDEYGLSRYCFLICHWICHIHCHWICRFICPPALECDLEEPKGCLAEEVSQDLKALVVAVRGTASGANFSRYVIEWSTDDLTYHNTYFHYPPIPPGGGTQGNNPVTSGLLAYFDTTALDAGNYFIRMTAYSRQGATKVCKTQFSLFKQDVRILGISGYTNLDQPALDPNAQFVETFTPKCTNSSTTTEVSFARCISIQGSAFVGGCDEKRIKRYLIDYKPGHETDCDTGGWANVWSVEYNTVWQYRDMNMRMDTSNLTAKWATDCVIPIPFPPYCVWEVPEARLTPSCWQTKVSDCHLNGLITLRLVVEDVDGNRYCDLQRLWIDNKPIHAAIQIDSVASCADINISDFAAPPDCSDVWPLPLTGLAYDEYIDETLPLTRPNDNFDHYYIEVSKQGGPTIPIPINSADGSCFYGTDRVGVAGNRCQDPGATTVFGKLADFDLRAVDSICKASVSYPVPDAFTIPRGECCVYLFHLRVYDRTKFAGGPHWKQAFWPVKICNDLT